MALGIDQRVPESLAKAQVDLGQENPVELGTFWSESLALIVFVRHFGCIGCDAQLLTLRPVVPTLEHHGARLVIVGNGPPHMLQGFAERHHLDCTSVVLATDPSLNAFKAAGLLRSVWATVGPRSVLSAMGHWSRGARQRAVAGDNFQQGGALIVDLDGTLRFYYRNEHLGDHASVVEMVEALIRLRIQKS